jgi:dCMP deaminase
MAENNKRPSWDEYFLNLLKVIAERATCDRGKASCVIVRDKHILSTGYVGSARGLPHCDDVGHLIETIKHKDGTESQHCLRTIHAEQNAICQAAKLGIALEGSTIYVKMTPCRTCAMMIINCGIKRVVCARKYHKGKESEEMFKQAGITIEFAAEEIVKYDNQ